VREAGIQREVSTELDAYLAPEEKVLWRGKPERKEFVFRTWPLSLFGALLIMSVIAYETVILTSDAPRWLVWWGVPFALAGLYMAVGHFLVTSYEWRQTEYLITPSRLLIRHGIFSPKVTVYSLIGLPHTQVRMHGENVGSILFEPREGEGYGPWPGYQNMWPYTPGYLLGLMYVRHPQEVQKVIERARRGSWASEVTTSYDA
jgi:hypothetical protein